MHCKSVIQLTGICNNYSIIRLNEDIYNHTVKLIPGFFYMQPGNIINSTNNLIRFYLNTDDCKIRCLQEVRQIRMPSQMRTHSFFLL